MCRCASAGTASMAPTFAPPPKPADSFKVKPSSSGGAHPPVPAKPDYTDA